MPTTQVAPEGERKTERISLRVTSTEMKAVRKVAAALGENDYSLLLREHSLADIVARYEKMEKVKG